MRYMIGENNDLAFECMGNNNFVKSINWYVTSKCNYNCKFCNMIDLNDEITEILDLKTILSKLNQLEIKNINLVGGEPLLYPFTYDIIKTAKRMGFITSITTNGSLLTKSKNPASFSPSGSKTLVVVMFAKSVMPLNPASGAKL